MDLLKILDTKPVPTIVDSQTLGASGNVSGDYWLPTTMCLYQKELTDQIVSLHYSDILRYFETMDYKADVVLESMRTMCLNSEYVATHPYLLINHYMPKSLITRDIPAHLAETSGKFVVLRDLMNLVQKYETNTAIICRPGRTMDLVEALLLGNKVNIKRYDGSSIKSKQKKPKTYACTCHLFPSSLVNGKNFQITISDQFDMVISVDPSVDTDATHIQKILKHSRSGKGPDARAPIVRLISINSVDHCNIYFSKRYPKDSTELLSKITAGVVVLRDRVGTLPPDLRPIYSQHLNYLVEWLEDSNLPWPLPDVYPIKKYNPMDVERSLLSEVKFNQVEDLDAIFNTNSKKRGRHKDRHGDGSYNHKNKSYYELKRLKNDYSTNPTKQGMKQLTGITTAGEEDSVNYHLVSGILTHKLIQSIGQVYYDIERQVDELNDYDSMSLIEDDHVNFYTKERDSINIKLQDFNKLIEKFNEDSKNLELSNNKNFDTVQKMEGTYATSLANFECKSDLDRKLKHLIIEKKSLLEELEREERQKESKLKEKEYMTLEIKRANEAVTTSIVEINNLKTESETIQNTIRAKFEKDSITESDVNIRIDKLKEELKEEEKYHDELEGKLSNLIKKLHQVPTTRVRSTNTTKNKGRRK
ncbi:similar to Saccharomyces cerevisiae YPR179C HDA3 Subunit of a possibly tetrameric trichostatin A-sensitive class II histone deacetylase complex [Maudiozyma saulgeensis]|uniref:Similar to Saccharomyces cerevisiae YPR179C HDA3 Subunit of a possibly tetrameric trichostatin A-sensitive class II histone deacetylase complex n=1 Tax=Maudiozyma saulgeensis TaxID=1789683 RepID=A0A1X7R2L7_9SACH|nr:similar to Saccharomyces cerevisiae YPR179C HDA3 Subunit of a possibly tetrameric trichostatin A-sensitive class II histone deacetylase complex [Kazachstania saulgeensis]